MKLFEGCAYDASSGACLHSDHGLQETGAVLGSRAALETHHGLVRGLNPPTRSDASRLGGGHRRDFCRMISLAMQRERRSGFRIDQPSAISATLVPAYDRTDCPPHVWLWVKSRYITVSSIGKNPFLQGEGENMNTQFIAYVLL